MVNVLARPSIRETRFLSRDQVQQLAPAVFAEAPSETVSDRYAFISTKQIFDILESEGYLPVLARSGRGEATHARHLVSFQHRDAAAMMRVGDTISRLNLFNSHDGKSAYQMLAGMWRLVCSNGLVVSDGNSGKVSVRHSGRDVHGAVIEAITKINEYLPHALGVIERLMTIELKDEARRVFGESILMMHYGEAGRDLILPDAQRTRIPGAPIDESNVIEGEVIDRSPIYAPITVQQLLSPRRMDDRNGSLYTAYNVAQENLTRGGIRGAIIDKDGNVTRRSRKTRAVTAVDRDREMNIGLWTLTTQMANLLN